jgi:hypothetical protein
MVIKEMAVIVVGRVLAGRRDKASGRRRCGGRRCLPPRVEVD